MNIIQRFSAITLAAGSLVSCVIHHDGHPYLAGNGITLSAQHVCVGETIQIDYLATQPAGNISTFATGARVRIARLRDAAGLPPEIVLDEVRGLTGPVRFTLPGTSDSEFSIEVIPVTAEAEYPRTSGNAHLFVHATGSVMDLDLARSSRSRVGDRAARVETSFDMTYRPLTVTSLVFQPMLDTGISRLGVRHAPEALIPPDFFIAPPAFPEPATTVPLTPAVPLQGTWTLLPDYATTVPDPVPHVPLKAIIACSR